MISQLDSISVDSEIRLTQPSQNGCPGLNPVSNIHLDIGVNGKINIQTRSKTDNPETLSAQNPVFRRHLADDAPGNQAGDLHEADVPAIVSFQQDGVVFILF